MNPFDAALQSLISQRQDSPGSMLQQEFDVTPNMPLCSAFCDVVVALDFNHRLTPDFPWRLEIMEKFGPRPTAHIVHLNDSLAERKSPDSSLPQHTRWQVPHGQGINMLSQAIFLKSGAPPLLWPRRVLVTGALLNLPPRNDMGRSQLRFTPYTIQPAQMRARPNGLDFGIVGPVLRQEFALTRPARL